MANRKKPTALKLLDGNPGKTPISKDEPMPPDMKQRFPDPPAYFDDYARERWEADGQMLAVCGILTEADLPAFEILCVTWSQFRHAIDAVQAEGMVTYDGNGKPSRNPNVVTLEKARSDYLRQASHFGTTPSARSNVQRAESTETRSADKFLNR